VADPADAASGVEDETGLVNVRNVPAADAAVDERGEGVT